MEWLFILALGAVALWQGVRLTALSQRVAQLEQQVRALRTEAAPVAAEPAPALMREDAVAAAPALAPADEREPLLLDQPIAEDELLLDTPLPEVSNDVESLEPPPVRPASAARSWRSLIAAAGLRFDHMQALGFVVLISALLAPALAGARAWPTAWLALYLAAVGAIGLALAAFQRWSLVAAAALAGLYFWFWQALATNEIRTALGLLSFASFGAVALGQRPPLTEPAQGLFAWRRVYELAPTIGIVVSSVFLIFVWAIVATGVSGHIAGPALISVFHVALAAYAVRGRVALPSALIVATCGLVAGCAAYLQVRFHAGPLGGDFYPVMLAAALATVLCTLCAEPHRRWRPGVAATAALGTAILIALTSFTRPDWHIFLAWAPLFGGALVLFAAAWLGARNVSTPSAERTIDYWAGAAAALALLGVESAFPAEARAPAYAGGALLFSSSLASPGWRVLRYAAIGAAALALAHARAPALLEATLGGQIPIWGALVILAVTAVLLFAAGYFAKAEPRLWYSMALFAAGATTLAIGAFLVLRSAGVQTAPALALVVLGGALALIIFLQLRAPRLYSAMLTRSDGALRVLGGRAHAIVDRASRWFQPAPKPTDLINVTPSARRDRRYGRRQRTQ